MSESLRDRVARVLNNEGAFCKQDVLMYPLGKKWKPGEK